MKGRKQRIKENKGSREKIRVKKERRVTREGMEMREMEHVPISSESCPSAHFVF